MRLGQTLLTTAKPDKIVRAFMWHLGATDEDEKTIVESYDKNEDRKFFEIQDIDYYVDETNTMTCDDVLNVLVEEKHIIKVKDMKKVNVLTIEEMGTPNYLNVVFSLVDGKLVVDTTRNDELEV